MVAPGGAHGRGELLASRRGRSSEPRPEPCVVGLDLERPSRLRIDEGHESDRRQRALPRVDHLDDHDVVAERQAPEGHPQSVGTGAVVEQVRHDDHQPAATREPSQVLESPHEVDRALARAAPPMQREQQRAQVVPSGACRVDLVPVRADQHGADPVAPADREEPERRHRRRGHLALLRTGRASSPGT